MGDRSEAAAGGTPAARRRLSVGFLGLDHSAIICEIGPRNGFRTA